MPTLIRPLNVSELASIERVLRDLREHFHQWRGYEGFEHELVSFAYYEGCGGTDHCGAILADAAPIALGQELVKHYAFEWVAIDGGSQQAIGVRHDSLSEAINLLSLEDGRYDDGTHDELPAPGEVTNQSLDGILKSVGVSRRQTR